MTPQRREEPRRDVRALLRRVSRELVSPHRDSRGTAGDDSDTSEGSGGSNDAGRDHDTDSAGSDGGAERPQANRTGVRGGGRRGSGGSVSSNSTMSSSDSEEEGGKVRFTAGRTDPNSFIDRLGIKVARHRAATDNDRFLGETIACMGRDAEDAEVVMGWREAGRLPGNIVVGAATRQQVKDCFEWRRPHASCQYHH